MNRSFKNMLGLSVLAGLLIWASCSSDNVLLPGENEVNVEHKAPPTITAITPGADTRLVYEEGQDGTISTQWKEGDEIILLSHESRTQYTYVYKETIGTGKAIFEWKEGTGEFNGEFSAFYNMNRVSRTSYSIGDNPRKIGGEARGVEQDGDNTFDHLISWNSMLAKGTCEGGKITEPLQFRSMMSMWSLKINMPDNETPRQVWLIADEPIFEHAQFYRLQTDEFLSTSALDAFTIALSDVSTNTFTANILLAPGDLREKSFRVVVSNGANEYFVSSIRGTNFESGKRYIKEINVNQAFEGEGTAESPWLLSEADDLRFMSEIAEYNNVMAFGYLQEYFRLTNDIDLGNIPFTPIYSASIFFDGDGHTISGLKIEEEDISAYGGLFAMFRGSVKDLTVEGTINSYTTAGGIAGYMDDVTLSGHIVSNVRIQAPNVTESYDTGMGGISGEVENCSLEDGTVLENKGAITGPTAGGLFGYAHTDLNNLENSTFINSGDITGVNESATAKNVYAGGFIGRIEATSAEGFTFPAGSNSTGTVSASAWGSEMEAWAGWKIGHAAELDDMSSVEATQKANEGYTGAPAVTASNPDGGSVYVNGAKE